MPNASYDLFQDDSTLYYNTTLGLIVFLSVAGVLCNALIVR